MEGLNPETIIVMVQEHPWVMVVLAVHLVANLVTMFIPSVSDNKIMSWVLKILNTLALNMFKNVNADEVLAKHTNKAKKK